jgi:DNA-binding MarR family transcriptional regulator
MTPFDEDEIVRLRTVFGKMSRLLNREVDTSGLSRTQLSVLSSVVRLGPLGLSELAEIEGVNPTMLSRIIAKLDERGLIRRIPDEQDRRAARVEVTEHGQAVQEMIRSDRARLLARSVDSLTPEQARALRAALEALEALATPALVGQVSR